MVKRILWDEVCIGCGKHLRDNEIYSGLCVNCQCGRDEQIKVELLDKLDIKKAMDEVALLPDLTMHDFIQNSVERNDFEWFKANKGFVIKHIEDLRKENKQLKETLASAIVPKFKIGQEVWCIERHWKLSKGEWYTIEKHEIEWFKVYRISKKQTKPIVAYRIKTYGTGKAYLYYEKDIFATEELAKKRFEELNGGAQC